MSGHGSANIGTGTYTDKRDIDVVSRGGLYASTYELIARHSRTKAVLDLGCSDGVGTYGLSPDFEALGVDFDPQSVELANDIARRRSQSGEGPHYEAVYADLLHPSPELLHRLRDTPFDTVVALDVLEHFTWTGATSVLDMLRGTLGRHVVIVSMPVISLRSIETYRGLAGIVRDRSRPQDGLFDRTHEILKGKAAHRRLFRESGYRVLEEYQTDHVIGTSGDWQWQAGHSAAHHLQAEIDRRTESGHRFARYLTQVYAAAQSHPLARRAVEAAVVYQGLYVLSSGRD